MYLSTVKSGIKVFKWLRAMLHSCLPDSLCYLCQQPAAAQVCRTCEHDCLYFNYPVVPANLLQWPPIKKGLTRGYYSSVYACGYYQWPLNQLVKQFKTGHPQLAQTLAEWFVRYAWSSEAPLPGCILPVPTSAWRFARRRYHQTLLLANAIGQKLSVPVYTDWASRGSLQRKQQLLGRQARLNNLTQAYTLSETSLPSRVAILDDVVTTGATAATLSKMLKAANPDIQIDLWAIAITPSKPDSAALVPGSIRKLRMKLPN